MNPWYQSVAVGCGGALGAGARYWLGYYISRHTPGFPWATFVVNVTGCFAIGLLGGLGERYVPHPALRIFLFAGFLGGYTTFSTFAYESLALLERGRFGLAASNVLGSVLCCLAAVTAGLALARSVHA